MTETKAAGDTTPSSAGVEGLVSALEKIKNLPEFAHSIYQAVGIAEEALAAFREKGKK